MPIVLLITEQERLKRLFRRLEQAGTLRLRVAPTFAQAEEEISTRQPDYVFGEHIPGLSNLALENFLHQLLSDSTRIVLMTQGHADAAELREADLLVVDLSQSDDTLLGAIADLIPAGAPPDDSPFPEPPPPGAPQKIKDLLRADGDPRSGAATNGLRYGLPSVLALAFLCVVVFQQYRKTATAPTGAGEAGTPMAPAAKVAASTVVPSVASAAKPAPVAATAAPPVSSQQPQQASSTRVPKVSKAVAKHAVAIVPAVRQRTVKPATQSGASGSNGPSAPSGRRHTIVVQQNDTVLKILTRDYGLTYRDAMAEIPAIKTLNRISDLDKVLPGQTLQLPSSLRPAEPGTDPQPAP